MKFKNITKITALAIFVFASGFAKSQISAGGTPYSFINKTKDVVAAVKMQAFDVQSMLAEDKQNEGKAIPFRFGKTFEVNYSPKNSGTFETFSNGDKLWRLRIVSYDAYSIGVIFGKYKLPEGAKLFIYASDKSKIIGSFTSENNKESGVLATAQVPTEEIIVEYYEPAKANFPGELQINKIIHDYRNIFGNKSEKGLSGGESLPCNVNIICPEAEDWQIEKHAVCKIIMSNSLCSGAMINNTAYDGTPYFLTAQHCVNTQATADETVFYFNYEATKCNDRQGENSQTLSGSDLIAVTDIDILDFAMLKMSKAPPENYQPYLAGWNRSTAPAKNVTGIHHPAGDIKKFSYDEDRPVTGTFSEYRSGSHWLVAEFEIGTTQGGSSGSPMFDENHRIVGDLSGGPQDETCDGLRNLYQKFDLSWDLYEDIDKQLKFWLDPLETGEMTTDGFYLYEADQDAQIAQVIAPTASLFCDSEGKLEPKIKIYNRGNSNLTSLTVNYTLDNGTPVTYDWTGDLLKEKSTEITLPESIVDNGTHDIEIYTSNPNGKEDGNNRNDTTTFSFEVDKAAAQVELTILTDNSGDQTTWEITDKNETILFSGGPYAKGSPVSNNYVFCLTDGEEFVFTIYDSAGDGMKSNGFGFWKLDYGWGSERTERGGSFNDKEVFNFTAESVNEIPAELKNNISVFPNPTTGIINIESIDIEAQKVEISDITGKIILTEEIKNNKKELNISNLQNGIYLINIYTEKGILYDKIILNK